MGAKGEPLPPGVVRCAIYTRKSTSAGLEKDFNSLDAQREACVACVHSQASRGTLAPAPLDPKKPRRGPKAPHPEEGVGVIENPAGEPTLSPSV